MKYIIQANLPVLEGQCPYIKFASCNPPRLRKDGYWELDEEGGSGAIVLLPKDASIAVLRIAEEGDDVTTPIVPEQIFPKPRINRKIRYTN